MSAHPIVETVARAIDHELSFNDHFTPDSIAQAAITALFDAIAEPTPAMLNTFSDDKHTKTFTDAVWTAILTKCRSDILEETG